MHDEELRPVSIRTRVGHGNGATEIFTSKRFVFEFVPRSACTGAGGVTTLDHEAVNGAVEDGAVVEVVFSEIDKVVNGDGGVLRIESNNNISFVGFEGGDVGFLRVNLHTWLRKIFICWCGCIHGWCIGWCIGWCTGWCNLRIFIN